MKAMTPKKKALNMEVFSGCAEIFVPWARGLQAKWMRGSG